MDERVQISLRWHDLRKLAVCAGLRLAFGGGEAVRGVLAGLDAQHPELPSLVVAADTVAETVRSALAEERS